MRELENSRKVNSGGITTSENFVFGARDPEFREFLGICFAGFGGVVGDEDELFSVGAEVGKRFFDFGKESVAGPDYAYNQYSRRRWIPSQSRRNVSYLEMKEE